MPDPISHASGFIDFTDRFFQSSAIVGSPAAGSSTSVCAATWAVTADNPTIVSGVQREGFVAFTAGTNGVSAKLYIRRTNTTGAVVATTGAVTVSAASLYTLSVAGFDTVAASPGAIWILALTVGSGSASSTVSAVQLQGFVV